MRRTSRFGLTTGLVAVAALTAATVAGDHLIVSPSGGERPLFGDGSSGTGGGPAASAGVGVKAAGDHLVDMQCLDGGWEWEWEPCSGDTPGNTAGPIGDGVLRAWELTGDGRYMISAILAGERILANEYAPGIPRFGTHDPQFLTRLSALSGDGQYVDWMNVEYLDALHGGTYGSAPYDSASYVAIIVSSRLGSGWGNIIAWDLMALPEAATARGNPGQATIFMDGVLGSLDTLDAAGWHDSLGLAGAIYALSTTGATTLPAAVVSPNYPDINGMTTTAQLVNYLISKQNANGSWYWNLHLTSADASDEDTQDTAYAVMALVAAEAAGIGTYTTEIASAQAWLWSVQDPTDGAFFSAGDMTGKNSEVIGEALYSAGTLAPGALTLTSDSCNEPGGTLTVEITVSDLDAGQEVVGGQYFLEFNTSVLTYAGITANPDFPTEILLDTSVPGVIDYSNHIVMGGSAIVEPTWMARIDFTVVSGPDLCDTADLVEFRWHDPPTRLSDPYGESIELASLDLGVITIDGGAPVLTCPDDIHVSADAGECTANPDPGFATATDTCDPSPVITWVRSDGETSLTDLYDSADSPITITWTATDACGNFSDCVQTITVDAVNELVVTVELSPNIDTGGVLPDVLSRCITFELWDCTGGYGPFEEKAVVDFTVTAGTPNVAIGTALLYVPCDVYDCITARDELHTLRRTDESFFNDGTQYVADFTADVDSGGDWLVGGNLNDDEWIDILDFGVFIWQFGADYGTGDTDCDTPYPHADISGDGLVNSLDYGFIAINYFEGHEANCCGAAPKPLRGPKLSAASNGPIGRISIHNLIRRDMAHLIQADLNHDGWLDWKDMQAFSGGARP